MGKDSNDRQVIHTVCRSTRPEQVVEETAKRAKEVHTIFDALLGLAIQLYSKHLRLARERALGAVV
jgi:hypothetical protein